MESLMRSLLPFVFGGLFPLQLFPWRVNHGLLVREGKAEDFQKNIFNFFLRFFIAAEIIPATNKKEIPKNSHLFIEWGNIISSAFPDTMNPAQ